MTQQEKELRDAAMIYTREFGEDVPIQIRSSAHDGFIKGAQWQSQQKQETDPNPSNKIAEMIEALKEKIQSGEIEDYSLQWHILTQQKSMLEEMLFMPEFNLQKKQETPELEEIRKEFTKRFKKHSFLFSEIEEMFNFFAQYIKGTEWVDCKERMPEQDQLVLCYGKGGRQFTGRFKEKKTFLVYDHHDFVGAAEDVIFWQPIPKAPKEVGG